MLYKSIETFLLRLNIFYGHIETLLGKSVAIEKESRARSFPKGTHYEIVRVFELQQTLRSLKRTLCRVRWPRRDPDDP